MFSSINIMCGTPVYQLTLERGTCNEKEEEIIFIYDFIFYDYACCVQFTGSGGNPGYS